MIERIADNHAEFNEQLGLNGNIIVLVGREGSGKSTVAKRLAKEAHLPYISVGDVLREFRDNDPGEYGDACRDMFEKNVYLEASLLLEILKIKLIGRDDLKDGFILDGALRSTAEVDEYPNFLKETGLDHLNFTVVHLRAPAHICYERLASNSRGRKEDTVSGILGRFSHYNKGLGERTSHIRNTSDWRFISVNGMGTEEECYKEVVNLLQK